MLPVREGQREQGNRRQPKKNHHNAIAIFAVVAVLLVERIVEPEELRKHQQGDAYDDYCGKHPFELSVPHAAVALHRSKYEHAAKEQQQVIA